MPARVTWLAPGSIILYTISDPISIEEIEEAEEEVWALAAGNIDLIDMVLDFRDLHHFPRGTLPAVKDGHFALPTLGRIALVGDEPLFEMMMTELARATFRPDPTLHRSVTDAATVLKRMADEDS